MSDQEHARLTREAQRELWDLVEAIGRRRLPREVDFDSWVSRGTRALDLLVQARDAYPGDGG